LEDEAPEPPKPLAAVQPPTRPSTSSSSSGGQVGLLEERIDMYKKAEAAAKSAGDSGRARRFLAQTQIVKFLLSSFIF
jgi:hypothetical protein